MSSNLERYKREMAIEVMAQGHTWQEAAKLVKVSQSKFREWLAEADFLPLVETYQKARSDLFGMIPNPPNDGF